MATQSNVNYGAYHLSDSPDLYEPARSNTFDFLVPFDTFLKNKKFLRAGYDATKSAAELNAANSGEYLRIAVSQAAVPTFSQQPIEIRRGNSVMKAAGLPTFKEGSIVVHDFIGADTKAILMAWQNLSYNVKTEKVGMMKDYKIDCSLIEYDPSYSPVNIWTLKGCWISSLDMPDFSQEDGGKRQITATIQYDSAYLEKDIETN